MSYRYTSVVNEKFMIKFTEVANIPKIIEELQDIHKRSFYGVDTKVIVFLNKLQLGTVVKVISDQVRAVSLSDGTITECVLEELANPKEGLFSFEGNVYIKDGCEYTLLCDINGFNRTTLTVIRFLSSMKVTPWYGPHPFDKGGLSDE